MIIDGIGFTIDATLPPPDVGGQGSPEDVTLDHTTSVSIDPIGDEDCFRFTLADQQILTATTSGECSAGTTSDTFLRLFDSGGTSITTDDNSGGQRC